MERVFGGDIDQIRENYFYYPYLFGGRWTHQCCPRYLKPEHFETVRDRLNRVSVYTGVLDRVISTIVDTRYSHYVLLDHMDWMCEHAIRDEWAVLDQHVWCVSGRLIWSSRFRTPNDIYKYTRHQ